MEKGLKSLECIPNPFITESFVLIDSDHTSLKVCDKSMNITINATECYKECPKQCSKKFRNINFKASHEVFIGDSYLNIKKDQPKVFSYQVENDLSIIQYFADLGGLFGLYLGISFIEIGTLINSSILFLKPLLNSCMNMEIFRAMTKIKRIFKRVNLILNYIERIDFKIVSKLIFPPIFIYQLFIMIDSYFEYSTQTNYEFIPYNISDNKYSVEEFPSITVCNEQLFDKIWFKNYYDPDMIGNNFWEDYQEYLSYSKDEIKKGLQNYCQSSLPYLEYIEKNITNNFVKYSIFDYIGIYMDYYYKVCENNIYKFCQKVLVITDFMVNILMANNLDEFKNIILRIDDKHTHGLNESKQMLDFYGQHYSCVTNNPSKDCSDLSPTSSLLSPLGKCHTFLYNNDNQLYVQSIDIKLNIILDELGSVSLYLFFPYYLLNRIILQDKSVLPSDKSVEITPFSNYMFYYNDMAIELKKTIMKRLNKPYDTECQDYGDSNQIDCLNKCYMKIYLNNFNCLPNLK